MTGIMLQAAVLIGAVLIIRALLGGRLHVYVRYGLWLAVALRLLVPVNLFDSPLSVLRFTEESAGSQSRFSGYRDNGPALKEADGVSGQADTDPAQTGRKDEGSGIWAAGDPDAQAPKSGAPIYNKMLYAVTDSFPVIWISGSLLAGTVLGLSRFRFYRKLRRTRVLCKDSEPPVYRVKGLGSPCLAGLLRPAIYIGDNIAEDSDYFRYAVTHETVHFVHRDHIWASVRAVLLTVYWFHPLVWAAAVCSVRDAELACDYGTVLRIGTDERFAYGEMLLELSRAQKGKKAYSFGMMLKPGKTELKGRIQRLMKTGTNKAWAGALAILLMMSMAGCAFTGASQETAAGGATLPEETKSALEKETEEAAEAVKALGEKAEEAEALTEEMQTAEEKIKTLAQEREALAEEMQTEEEKMETFEKERKVLEEKAEETKALAEKMQTAEETGDGGEVKNDAAYEDVDILYMEPCEYTRISDTFSEKTNPDTQEAVRHEGIDYVSEKGTDIVAAADGTVDETGFSADYGNYVVIRHQNGERTYYGCCGEIFVEKDMQVKSGDRIAAVGSTGRATGPHLHFAVMNKDGDFVDPQEHME